MPEPQPRHSDVIIPVENRPRIITAAEQMGLPPGAFLFGVTLYQGLTRASDPNIRVEEVYDTIEMLGALPNAVPEWVPGLLESFQAVFDSAVDNAQNRHAQNRNDLIFDKGDIARVLSTGLQESFIDKFYQAQQLSPADLKRMALQEKIKEALDSITNGNETSDIA